MADVSTFWAVRPASACSPRLLLGEHAEDWNARWMEEWSRKLNTGLSSLDRNISLLAALASTPAMPDVSRIACALHHLAC